MNELLDLMRLMLNDKEHVIKEIIGDMDTSKKNLDAFNKLSNLLESGTPVKQDKVNKAAAKALRHQQNVNMKLLALVLVYASGGSLDADAAKVMNKMGHGEEALKSMMKNKMGK